MTDIDPVTGLPTIASDPIIEQIPLSVQTFPWDDMGALARPHRGAIYGDDIIPTSALVTGLDDNGKLRAGTMTSDQRLRVDTGDSGGGSGAPTYQLVQTFAFEVFGNRSGDSFATTFFTQHNCVLLAMDIEWYWNNTTGISYSAYYHTLRLATNIGSGDIQLAGIRMIGGGSATYAPSPPTQKMFVFPGGLRLDPAVVPGDDDQFMLYSHGTVGDKLGINGTLWLGEYT